MNHDVQTPVRSLDQRRDEFSRRRFLAMPLAGSIAWVVVGVAGTCLAPTYAVWVLFIATGCIAWLGMLLSGIAGVNFLDKSSVAIPVILRDTSAHPGR